MTTPASTFRRIGWLLLVLLPLAVVVPVRLFVAESFRITSTSMAPALLVGDRVLVNRLAYRNGETPKRGDIVLFEATLPGEAPRVFVKRVIGLPGDTVEMAAGVLRVNGDEWQREPVAEVVLDDDGDIAPPGFSPATFELSLEHSPEGAWQVLKSRAGRAGAGGRGDGHWRIRPGHLLLLGDNRDDSIDGRAAAGYGQVPVEQLIGRARRVIWSQGAAGIRSERVWMPLR